MAVSLRVTGSWAELTADGAVAIPATPQAGDRMYLFARWKDFSITAQVTSPVEWTEIAEFADGSTSAGNGTGSVKVGCWYRDWESGDTNPTIDFSASPDNASVVIMVMQKDATDTWLTPVAVTAAMTNWTTTSQIVAASSTANVLGGGVVMGLIGIRDDTATMTRPTTGIDDSAGAITWNGNYVESPATHHSTTTGFDGAADLGYRLVSAGATATLRMTGTISAAETGAALWVVQGVQANLVIDNSAHAHSGESLVLTQVHAITVANAVHAHTAEGLVLTQVHVLTVQNGSHAQAVESLTLTQTHGLDVQNADHGHSAGGVTLEVIYDLVTQNAAHAHNVENLLLTQVHEITIDSAEHAHTSTSPNVKSTLIVYLDPGGDAVQAVGHFNSDIIGTVTYDTGQQVVGVGAYKFDSPGTGLSASVTVEDVLFKTGIASTGRRLSFYWRYDSVPDAQETVTEFVSLHDLDYSGGGFSIDFPSSPSFLVSDDEVYADATPAKNAGQGSVFIPQASLGIPIGAVIDSVKIIYERKYDVNTSIGISRVKWWVNGVEGPDHDNTDMPLTDTVVEVDVTADRGWTWQDLGGSDVFRIIVEARRGDSDTEHTQSWDYVKVEVVYHLPAGILWGMNGSLTTLGFQLAVTPKDDGVVVRFVDGAGVSYDGITKLEVDTWPRISLGFVLHGTDDLDIKIYVNSLEELSIVGASTGGAADVSHLQYGWRLSPGVDHVSWFDQLYIDDGDDLSDPGNVLMTAKLPASVNENNWSTTGGTGAVNERPLSETNYMKETEGIVRVRQSYTLQEADEGDVDLTGKTLVGHMGWAWFKVSATGEPIDLVVNGVNIDVTAQASTLPALMYHAETSNAYPSNAAGIGMRNAPELLDTFMYECGAVVAYEGPPPAPPPLLEFQLLAEDSITNRSDDLGAEEAETYTLRSEIGESADAVVTTTIYADVGGEQYQQVVIESHGGDEIGHTVIAPGGEVSTHTEVTGGDAEVGLERIPDVE